jgi:ribose transport system permease protein
VLNKIKFSWREHIVLIFFAIVFIFFAITIGDKGFLTITNMFNIFRSTAMVVVMAVAMTFVVGAGEIDLSVGATTALSAYIAALVMQAGYNPVIAVFLALLASTLVGATNGVLIAKVGIPAFLTTLGMQLFVRGIDMWITYTHPVSIANDIFNKFFGYGSVGPIPSLLIWSLVITVIGFIIFNYTSFGREVVATGGNKKAAKYSGVNTDYIKIKVFCLMGMMAGLAGLLYSGMMRTARYSFGSGVELEVLAAVFIGGTSIKGGNGKIFSTFIGALLIGMINNGIIVLGLDVSQQMMVSGAIILLAVMFSKEEL